MKAKEEGGSRRNSWDGHQLKGHEFEETLRDNGGKKSLECCRQQVHKESDTAKWVNDTTTLRVQNDDHSVMQLRAEGGDAVGGERTFSFPPKQPKDHCVLFFSTYKCNSWEIISME